MSSSGIPTLPATAEPFLVAVVQMNPRLADYRANSAEIVEKIEVAVRQGARLVVFPECALSGYVYDSLEEARPAAFAQRSAVMETFANACRRNNTHAIIGMLELDEETGSLYNSALVMGPAGQIACYRKCHLPVLGIDRYVGMGDSMPVIDLPFARIGVLICYDVRFPEAARSLALRGADILVVPTNWPEGADSAPEFLTRTRAWENRVYVVACNRVGVERGTRFIGRSQVVAPDGRFLAQADGEGETMLLAEIDPAFARQKKVVFVPGVFELDPVGGRRPELYGALTELEA